MKNLFENLEIIDYFFDTKKYNIRNTFDISNNFENIENYINNNKYYIIHEIKEGEKWETIAIKYYGKSNTRLFWIFVIMNKFEDVFYDFSLTTDELGKVTNYTEESNQITYTLFTNSISQNDEKRFIKILKKEYINDFEANFFKDII